MPGQRQWVLAARGTDVAADSAVSAVSAAKAMPVNSAARFWFMQVMAWARGLDNGLFKVANTQLSRERDVHGAHVDACTVYLLRVLIMAAISP